MSAPPVLYVVKNLLTQERGTFQTARDVATFMWGRDFRHYRIYKNGVLLPWEDGNLAAFRQALEAL